MKDNNKTGKIFGIINIIDLLIILLIIAIACVSYILLNKKIISTAPETKYKVTLEIKQMDEQIAEQIQTDKEVFNRVTNEEFGTLMEMRKTPSVSYNISSDKGKHVTAKFPNRYDVELDMEISTNDDMYIGKFLSIETKDFMGAGNVIAFEKADE